MNFSKLLEDFSSLNYHAQQELIGLLSKKWWDFMLDDINTFGRSKNVEQKYQELLSY